MAGRPASSLRWPFPWPGSARFFSFTLCANERADELTVPVGNFAALRVRCTGQIVTPTTRHARSRAAESRTTNCRRPMR